MELKILKNQAKGFCKKKNSTLYEYIIFDSLKQEYEKKVLTTAKAIKLVKLIGMEIISPLIANKQGFFNYKEVTQVDYPLPF